MRLAPASWVLCAVCALVQSAGADGTGAQTTNPCAGHTACTEVPTFIALVTDFRPGAAGTTVLVSATIRFSNKTPRELAVGYVDGSAVATDDRGNRYAVRRGSIGGIGTISSSSFDPKFTLQPGTSSDSRFEFEWLPASPSDRAGTTWDIEFAVREIDLVGIKQYKLGKQHMLQFHGFREGWTPRR